MVAALECIGFVGARPPCVPLDWNVEGRAAAADSISSELPRILDLVQQRADFGSAAAVWF